MTLPVQIFYVIVKVDKAWQPTIVEMYPSG